MCACPRAHRRECGGCQGLRRTPGAASETTGAARSRSPRAAARHPMPRTGGAAVHRRRPLAPRPGGEGPGSVGPRRGTKPGCTFSPSGRGYSIPPGVRATGGTSGLAANRILLGRTARLGDPDRLARAGPNRYLSPLSSVRRAVHLEPVNRPRRRMRLTPGADRNLSTRARRPSLTAGSGVDCAMSAAQGPDIFGPARRSTG